MHEWLEFRPLIVFLIAGPVLVVVALLVLLDRGQRDAKDGIESRMNGIHDTQIDVDKRELSSKDKVIQKSQVAAHQAQEATYAYKNSLF